MAASLLQMMISKHRGLKLNQFASDSELIRRIQSTQDVDAFEELLERYASLVWGVCRRLLRDDRDCEDAFQAVFLSLFRQIRSIDISRPLAAWLYTVSLRIARKARLRNLKRRNLPLQDEYPVSTDLNSSELYAIIDEEIAKLPDQLRTPIILCCLQDKTRDEAAEQLGCTIPAVKSRLERGRLMLRNALRKRGIELPAVMTILILGTTRINASLKARTIESVFGSAPLSVSSLLGTIAMGKAAVACCFVAIIGIVAAGSLELSAGQKEAKSDQKASNTVANQSNEISTIVDRFGDALPEGAVRRFGTLRFRHSSMMHAQFTTDGSKIVTGTGNDPLAVFDSTNGKKLLEVGARSANNNYGFALTPDGKTVVSLGFDVTQWNLETGARIRDFGAGRCKSVAISPDGKRLAVIREQQAAGSIFELETGRKLCDLTFANSDQSKQLYFDRIDFTSDGKSIVGPLGEIKQVKPNQYVVKLDRIMKWDSTSGKPNGEIEFGDGEHLCFATVPKTNLIAIIQKDNILKYWDLNENKSVREVKLSEGLKEVKKENSLRINLLRFCEDGSRFAIIRSDGMLCVWDAKQGKEIRRIDTESTQPYPISLAMSADGRKVAFNRVYFESCLRVWDVDRDVEILGATGHRSAPTMRISPDGKTLLSKSANEEYAWDLASGTGKLKRLPNTQRVDANSAMIHETTGSRWKAIYDARKDDLIIKTLDGSREIRRIKTPRELCRATTISGDGRRIAIAFQDQAYSLYIWTPEEEEKPFILTGHPDACQILAFSNDGKTLVAGAGTHNRYPTEVLFVYDVLTGKLIRKLESNSSPGHLRFTKDDRTLISGGLWNDATTNVWDMETGKRIATLIDPQLRLSTEADTPKAFAAISAFCFSEDERFLAVASEIDNSTSIAIWETHTWKVVKIFKPTVSRNRPIMLFSHDGRSLFVANADTTILQWDISGLHGKPTAQTLSPMALEDLWRQLRDPSSGYIAAWKMLDAPADSLSFLKTKLTPAKPIATEQVKALLKKLDSPLFRDREEAARQLLQLGDGIEFHLKKEKDNLKSEEVKNRIDKILTNFNDGALPEQSRTRKVISILEWMKTAEATKELQKLAEGDEAASQTRQAKAALMRLSRNAKQ